MADNIEELRKILFDTIREVKGGTIDLDKAKAIENLSQTIINSAKVEVEYMRVTDKTIGTSFLEKPKPEKESPTYLHEAGNKSKLSIG